MSDSLIVGISDYKIAKATGMLVTYALGSCVGICLYDRKLKLGGLAHIMLPDSGMFSGGEMNRMKFADTALPDMLMLLKKQGASQPNLTARIAGGAQMFQTTGSIGGLGLIGDRNVHAVKKVLSVLRIPLTGEDTGADYGRTVYFDVSDGSMKIQSMNKIIKTM